MPEMILVSEKSAVYNCAEDTIAFCLAPETFPVFWAWMKSHDFVEPDYTEAMMQHDMAAILAAIKSHPRTVRGRG